MPKSSAALEVAVVASEKLVPMHLTAQRDPKLTPGLAHDSEEFRKEVHDEMLRGLVDFYECVLETGIKGTISTKYERGSFGCLADDFGLVREEAAKVEKELQDQGKQCKMIISPDLVFVALVM